MGRQMSDTPLTSKERVSGFEPIPEHEMQKPCTGGEHNPPTHLWIPPGQQYRHICPACGHETILRNYGVHCRV